MHSAALRACDARPGAHVAQVRSCAVLGSSVTRLPASHTVTSVHRPPRTEKRPAAHASQPAAVEEASKPTAQSPQEAAPSALHLPAGHCSHEALPLVLLNVPAAHAPHEAAPLALNPPASG